MDLPKTTRCLVLENAKEAQTDGPAYHDVVLAEREVPALKEGEVLVRIRFSVSFWLVLSSGS
jgi:hypothetical protein